MGEKIKTGIKSYKLNKKFYYNHKHGGGYYFNFVGEDGKDYSVFVNQHEKAYDHYKPISVEGEVESEKDFYGKTQYVLKFPAHIEYESAGQTATKEDFMKILEDIKASNEVHETDSRNEIPDDAIYVASFGDSEGNEYSWYVTDLELFKTSKGEYWFLNNCYWDTLD